MSNQTEMSNVSMSPGNDLGRAEVTVPTSPSPSTPGDVFMSTSPSPFILRRERTELTATENRREASGSANGSAAELLEPELFLGYISEENAQQNIDRAEEEDDPEKDDPISF